MRAWGLIEVCCCGRFWSEVVVWAELWPGCRVGGRGPKGPGRRGGGGGAGWPWGGGPGAGGGVWVGCGVAGCPAGGVGDERGEAVGGGVGKPPLGAGVCSFGAGVAARSATPSRHVGRAGGLGDPRPLPRPAVEV